MREFERSGVGRAARLVRFLSFDGEHVHFADHSDLARRYAAPLHSAYHSMAKTLRPYQVCKAALRAGQLILLIGTAEC